jgi:large subunit ribosomal protein L4e
MQFDSPVRADIIKRAVTAINNNQRQPYGAYPMAGKRSSAKLSRRRNDYRGSYGHGISRVPRKILSVRGTRFNWVGAFAPGTVGGRRAHPPKIEKNLFHKINSKENRFAIRSAIAASVNPLLVKSHGHLIPSNYPFCLADSFENIMKTTDFTKSIQALGFEQELIRTRSTKQRAGRGKARGRRTITRTGPLIVTSANCNLTKAGNNIPGFEIVTVNYLNANILAPGGIPGRAVLFTKSAIDKLAKNNLYLDHVETVSVKESKPVLEQERAHKKPTKKSTIKSER